MPLSLLIVDDSSMMRAMLRRAVGLAEPSVVIHEAGNGAEAIEVLERHHVDALFTDINMPVMSGMDLLRALPDRGWQHIQAVIISTDGTEVRHAEAMSLNVQMYLTKPFAPGALQDVLDRVMEARRG